jgi:hypothetical protein
VARNATIIDEESGKEVRKYHAFRLGDQQPISFTTVTRDQATGLAMRYYAGFLDMAKALRKNDRDGNEIRPQQRGEWVEAIHVRATQDKIYRAGVCFGWWGIERRAPKEQVIEDGISEQHKQLYLSEYHQHKKSSTGDAGPQLPSTH